MIKTYNSNWKNYLIYPYFYSKLKDGLNEANCPMWLQNCFDRALQVNLGGGLLSKEFTIFEAFEIDNWVSHHTKPKGFPYLLSLQFKNELGIEFKNDKAC